MTTRTISEMITITKSTRTAAATVSSERRAGRERERHDGEFAWTCRGQKGSAPVSGPEISRCWWRSMRAAWIILWMGNYLYMRLLQFLPLKRMGQNSVRGMQYSLKRCSNINLLNRMWIGIQRLIKWGWGIMRYNFRNLSSVYFERLHFVYVAFGFINFFKRFNLSQLLWGATGQMILPPCIPHSDSRDCVVILSDKRNAEGGSARFSPVSESERKGSHTDAQRRPCKSVQTWISALKPSFL